MLYRSPVMFLAGYILALIILSATLASTSKNSSLSALSERVQEDPQNGPSSRNSFSIGPVALDTSGNSMRMSVRSSDGNKVLSAKLGTDSSTISPFLINTNTQQKNINVGIPKVADVEMRSYKYRASDCVDISWRVTKCASEVLTDCFDLGTAHWYGGAEVMMQMWPLEKVDLSMKPYMAMEMMGTVRYGPVQERWFFNSDGFGIYIEENTPLSVSINSSGDHSLCLQARFDEFPYPSLPGSLPELNYTVCTASDVKSIHQLMAGRYLQKPTGIPNPELFKYPIWSTWAQYKVNINQSLVESFVKDIKKYNFSISQIEIDDVWTPKYGDLDFDKTTFPDPKGMVDQMHRQNVPVTLWVHPFINTDSKAFSFLASKGLMMQDVSGRTPALTSWWNGKMAGHVDFSNPDAAQWFLSELNTLKTSYGVDSFKFDAGDISYLPPLFKAHQHFANRNVYARLYAETARLSDSKNRMEMRTGVGTQHMPVLVRVMDRYSTWGFKQGLKSVITAGLLFGILGYPFLLPDYISGNSYNTQPDPELFIRWVQANALMPTMQFSLLPWASNNSTVLEVSQDMVKLHEKYSDLIIQLANQSVTTGYPIMRPLWWIAPTDESALTVDDQFLLGDDVLVAPVVEQGQTTRKLYLPAGRWRDESKRQVYDGGKWIDYPVTLRDLPYFTKVT